MSFCIKNTISTLSKANAIEASIKQNIVPKIPISTNESVLKFDMTTNSWFWRDMDDNSVSCSIGPTGSLSENIPETIKQQDTNVEQDTISKKVEMSKTITKKQAYKARRRQQKKK